MSSDTVASRQTKPPAPRPSDTASAKPPARQETPKSSPTVVKTWTEVGRDGHQITYTDYRNPDGSITHTAVSPASYPPPNSDGNSNRMPRGGNPRVTIPPDVPDNANSSGSSGTSGAGTAGAGNASGSRAQTPAGTSVSVAIADPSADGANARAGVRTYRQGIDLVDHSIGEFDADRGGALQSDTGGSDVSATSRQPRLRDQDSGQAGATTATSRASASSSRPTAASAATDDTDPQGNRRGRARSGAAKTEQTAGAQSGAKPLLFGGVPRGAYVLAHSQPATVTRGVRLPQSGGSADTSHRPGVISGRGVAQFADLGRGSPAYGAAPEVFQTGPQEQAPAVAAKACKPRLAAKGKAAHAKASRNSGNTACS